MAGGIGEQRRFANSKEITPIKHAFDVSNSERAQNEEAKAMKLGIRKTKWEEYKGTGFLL